MRLHIAMVTLVGWLTATEAGLGAQAITAGPASRVTVMDQVEQQLRSDDPKEIAWGAYLAAQNHLRSAIPALQSRLAFLSPRDSVPPASQSLPAALAVLDALVQLDAQLPAESVRDWFDRCPVQALLLVANASSGRDDLLLSLLDSTSELVWQAVADVLLRTKPPGFARRLLSGLRLKVVVVVTDVTTNAGGGVGSGSGLGAASERNGGMVGYKVLGFPPLAEYQFTGNMPGAIVLTSGPHISYYERRVYAPGEYRPFLYAKSAPSSLDRVRYVNALLTNRMDGGPLFETSVRGLRWTNAATFPAQVVQERQGIEEHHGNVISQLVERGYLLADETSLLHPDIEIVIDDHRQDKSTPVPAVQ